MMDHLTDRQERILRAIRDCIADTGEGPSIRQLGARAAAGVTAA